MYHIHHTMDETRLQIEIKFNMIMHTLYQVCVLKILVFHSTGLIHHPYKGMNFAGYFTVENGKTFAIKCI